jgi:lysyl-tRNA synthetase class 2
LTNYPASQAALARLSADGLTAERFELYIDGIELCNGYDELTDASILRSRIREQTSIRSCHGLRPLPTTSRLLDIMDEGLPRCAGNALGVDRLIMLALGYHEIADVISFPFAIA